MCVSLQRRAIKNFEMSVWLQRRAQKCMKFAFRYSFARSTHRILREGSSSKFKMRVSLQRRAIKNFQMQVSLQPRAQKYMKQVTDAHRSALDTKIIVLPQFRRSDQHEVTKGFAGTQKNLHFTTVLSIRRSLCALRVARRRVKYLHFTTVLSV